MTIISSKVLFGCVFAMCGIAVSQDSTRVVWNAIPASVLQERVGMVKHKNPERQMVLEGLFQTVGCLDLHEQSIPGLRETNLICSLPGKSKSEILVGAHYDADDHGIGAVDDWSGASLLPTLYQSLSTQPRMHKFVFVEFSGEERGLKGSKAYVQGMSKDEQMNVHAMVNLECLGLSLPAVWVHRADKRLLEAYIRVADSVHLPRRGVSVDRVGDDDSHPFLDAKIPVITIHSVTQETWPILHTSRDQLTAIHPAEYYSAYRLIAAYLAYIDSILE